MAHKAHTFPETFGVYLVTKKPKTSPVQQQLPASVAVRVAVAGQTRVDRSIGESKNGN